MLTFFLGVHQPHWLAVTDVPLFVSHRRLKDRRTFPRARGPWALDSGGFTELSMHGRWTVTPKDYADAVKRYACEVGNLRWCAPQDYMCEPDMLRKTGLDVPEHQRRSVRSVQELRALGLPVIPVLQGWTIGQYFDCIELYDKAGFDLRAEPVVGVGTVCRRQHMASAQVLMNLLSNEGLRLHGFGFKLTGLRNCAGVLTSADSMAWSFAARRRGQRPECVGSGHKNCANCLPFALEWRGELLQSLPVNDDAGLMLPGIH